MGELLSLTRAARLVGVPRTDLQKRIQLGELFSHDGMVAVSDLLACYPNVQMEDNVELLRVAQIKERAFGKRVFERALPDAEVLAARITELSRSLAQCQSQVGRFSAMLGKFWDKLGELDQVQPMPSAAIADLKTWLVQEVEAAMQPGSSNPLAIKDGCLRVMTAQVTLLPSKQDFLVEGQDTLLEAAMRAGISLNYGCSGGNCGLCKAKVLTGEVKKTRHHDYVISERDKQSGYVLLCSNTAVSDLSIEAVEAGGVQDIPFQQITTKVKSLESLSDEMMALHLQTPRSQRLRFLAGQRAMLRVGLSFTATLPIASCPCDDRNLIFHVRRQPGNLFSDYVFDRLHANAVVELEGPQGEFILHEKSSRPLYFIALDDGFAPIRSLIEHALSREVESIQLWWVASGLEQLYQRNVARAWADALDGFSYTETIAGFDLRAWSLKREDTLLKMMGDFVAEHADIADGDIYIAGPEVVVRRVERFFLERGMPKTRVFAEPV